MSNNNIKPSVCPKCWKKTLYKFSSNDMYCDSCGFTCPEIIEIDRDRINLISEMDETQKDFFAIGLAFHSVWMTDKALKRGEKNVHPSDIKCMEIIVSLLNKYGLSHSLGG